MLCRRAVLMAFVAAAVVMAPGGSRTAVAGSRTGNLSVMATVVNSCVINSSTALAFGTYDPALANSANGGTDLAAGTGALTVTCTASVSRAIALGQGSNPGYGSTDAAPLRQMKMGSHVLAYALYQDAGDAVVWGNTPGTSLAGTATGSADSIPVYGVVPKGQNVPDATYSDVVVVTVIF
jgi:spore coat protein U-like protein